MIYCLGHSIISPLGEGSQANFESVQAGRSGLKYYTSRFTDVEPLCASLFEEPQQFVPLCIRSINDAIGHLTLDIGHLQETIFILSTTKGDNLNLWTPAEAIVSHFGNRNKPIVVSNACTSGVCAQITAMRLLDAGLYKYAIVVGCDIQSRFIVSGFQSFKALSDNPCLPFSPKRKGLNLGEAASVIIYSSERGNGWSLVNGSIHNDANHISAPSRTGDGAYLCLQDILEGILPNEIQLIGVHGTGTLYNDDMERVAIHRAGLDNVSMCILKPFFGHTMGAAGILETILCMMLAENEQKTNVIKMLSGFGGVNASIRLRCE